MKIFNNDQKIPNDISKKQVSEQSDTSNVGNSSLSTWQKLKKNKDEYLHNASRGLFTFLTSVSLATSITNTKNPFLLNVPQHLNNGLIKRAIIEVPNEHWFQTFLSLTTAAILGQKHSTKTSFIPFNNNNTFKDQSTTQADSCQVNEFAGTWADTKNLGLMELALDSTKYEETIHNTYIPFISTLGDTASFRQKQVVHTLVQDLKSLIDIPVEQWGTEVLDAEEILQNTQAIKQTITMNQAVLIDAIQTDWETEKKRNTKITPIELIKMLLGKLSGSHSIEAIDKSINRCVSKYQDILKYGKINMKLRKEYLTNHISIYNTLHNPSLTYYMPGSIITFDPNMKSTISNIRNIPINALGLDCVMEQLQNEGLGATLAADIYRFDDDHRKQISNWILLEVARNKANNPSGFNIQQHHVSNSFGLNQIYKLKIPMGYPSIQERELIITKKINDSRAFVSPIREIFWKQYLNLTEDGEGILVESPVKFPIKLPKEAKSYTIQNQFLRDIFIREFTYNTPQELILKAFETSQVPSKWQLTNNPMMVLFNAFGTFSWRINKDKDGTFLEIVDIWDLHPMGRDKMEASTLLPGAQPFGIHLKYYKDEFCDIFKL